MSNISEPATALPDSEAICYNALLHYRALTFSDGIVYDRIGSLELQTAYAPPSPFDKS